MAAAERELQQLEPRNAARLAQLEELAPGSRGRLVHLIAAHGRAAGEEALSLATFVARLGKA